MHEINYKFREQVLPFYLESTIVIRVTLSIYSCVANVTLEITSERHQTYHDLDRIITKRASETTAGVFRWLFISTYPTIKEKWSKLKQDSINVIETDIQYHPSQHSIEQYQNEIHKIYRNSHDLRTKNARSKWTKLMNILNTAI